MKSAITFSSILLGFFGTLLAQIVNLKLKYSNDENSSVNFFFNNVSSFDLKFVLLANVLNTVVLDVISLLILAQGEEASNYYLYIWACIFAVFIIHQCYVYYIFIELLLVKDNHLKIYGKLTDEQEKELNAKLSKPTIEEKAIRINPKIKHDD